MLDNPRIEAQCSSTEQTRTGPSNSLNSSSQQGPSHNPIAAAKLRQPHACHMARTAAGLWAAAMQLTHAGRMALHSSWQRTVNDKVSHEQL
jgi:hypothetical protein